MVKLAELAKETAMDGVGGAIGLWGYENLVGKFLQGVVPSGVAGQYSGLVSAYAGALLYRWLGSRAHSPRMRRIAEAASTTLFGAKLAQAFGVKDPPIPALFKGMGSADISSPMGGGLVPNSFSGFSPVALFPKVT